MKLVAPIIVVPVNLAAYTADVVLNFNMSEATAGVTDWEYMRLVPPNKAEMWLCYYSSRYPHICIIVRVQYHKDLRILHITDILKVIVRYIKRVEPVPGHI